MKDSPYVTNDLHRIGEHLSEAARARKNPSTESAPEAKEEKTYPLPPEKVLEFDRLRHDVEMRAEGQLALYYAESGMLNRRIRELEAAIEGIKKIKTDLAAVELPSETEADSRMKLSAVLRSFERMRLESIRISSGLDGSRCSGGGSGADPRRRSAGGAGIGDLSGSDLFRRGFSFFLPLGIFLLIGALILSAAFFTAWKVAL